MFETYDVLYHTHAVLPHCGDILGGVKAALCQTVPIEGVQRQKRPGPPDSRATKYSGEVRAIERERVREREIVFTCSAPASDYPCFCLWSAPHVCRRPLTARDREPRDLANECSAFGWRASIPPPVNILISHFKKPTKFNRTVSLLFRQKFLTDLWCNFSCLVT